MADIGIKQVYHLAVVGYYLYFDIFSSTELIANVSRINILKDLYPYMTPQFATVWSQFIFQDYFILSCLEDVLAFTPSTFLPSFKEILSSHANNVLIYVALPFTLVICGNFWVIFSIDPGLIDEYNILFDFLDHHSNHVVHTLVIPILLVELCITHRRYPASLTEAYPYRKMTMTFGCYWAVVFAMKLISPVWPYPYYRNMTPLEWATYILGNMVLIYIAYAFGFLCNALVWGKSEENIQEPPAKKEGWTVTSGWAKFSQLIQVVQGR